MARWKLTEAHYLNGHPPDLDETEWEYKEIDRLSGRERRRRFKVPFYFEAETVVCYPGQGQDGDYTIDNDTIPTAAMTPLDAEAKRISKDHEHEWVHPIDSLPGQGLSDAILTSLEKQIATLANKMPTPPVPAAMVGVTKEEFEEVKAQLAKLMARNAELEAAPKPRIGQRR